MSTEEAIPHVNPNSQWFQQIAQTPLPNKVTLAGTLVASCASIFSKPHEDPLRIVNLALERSAGIEPLAPFLGDEEWADLGPPGTLYLLTPDVRTVFQGMVMRMVNELEDIVPRLSASDAIMGILFHLDAGFRRGVTSMARGGMSPATPRGQFLYIPATHIGSPPVQH